MNTQFTVDYFIKKFEAIDERNFLVGDWNSEDAYCVNGHCGLHSGNYTKGTKEATAFNSLFSSVVLTPSKHTTFHNKHYFWFKTANINDGITKEYQQSTPKQRILAALYDIKKLQEEQIGKAVKEVIRYVSVPVSITEQAKELLTLS